MIAKAHNTAEIKAVNARNKFLAKQLAKTKEITTERTTGGRTTSSSFDSEAMLKAAEARGSTP